MTDEFELQPALGLLWPIIGAFYRRRRQASFRDVKATLEATPPAAPR